MGPGQFISELQTKKPKAAYFLSGPDRFLHEECRAAVIAALPPETRDWCLSEIEFQPKRVAFDLQNACQMPMLGGHSFFIFSDPEDFKHATDEDYAALESYLQRPSPFATIVFAAVEPDRRRRFIQLLEKKAEVVDLHPLNRRQASGWLKAYLARAGVEIEPTLAEEIASRFETAATSAASTREPGINLLWMRTEVQKLLASRPQAKRLQASDLEVIVAFREEREIGKLLRAIAERQCGPALEHLRALMAGKQSEVLVLWCVGDLFRQALRSISAAQAGRAPYAGRAGWSRNPYSTFEIAPVAVRKYSYQELLQALRHVRQTDLSIKSSWKDSRLLLEFLVWQTVAGKSAESPLLGGITTAFDSVER